MRNDPLANGTLFLLSINSDLVAVKRNPNLIRTDAGDFDANADRLRCLTNIDGRCPGAGARRSFGLCRLMKYRVQLADAVSQPLKLDPFKTGGPHAFYHSFLQPRLTTAGARAHQRLQLGHEF